MMRGVDSYTGRTVVVNENLTAACYIIQIVDLYIITFLLANRPRFKLQQDNVHTRVANVI